MGTDISGVIRSLHESAVGRCRERIEEAAQKARGRICLGEPGEEPAPRRQKYGVTSVLKQRHGL